MTYFRLRTLDEKENSISDDKAGHFYENNPSLAHYRIVLKKD